VRSLGTHPADVRLAAFMAHSGIADSAAF